MDKAPSPKLEIRAPIKQISAFTYVEFSGVTIDIIVNNSIPTTAEPITESQGLFLIITLIKM